MQPLTKAALVGTGTLLAGWVAWGLYAGRSAESVPFERRGSVNDVELRHYPQTVRVETTASNQRDAFRRLFDYISGTNDCDHSVSMTAPVETRDGTDVPMTAPVRSGGDESVADAVRMSFYLPAEYDSESAPAPTDPDVALVTEEPKDVAVSRFSWYAPEWRVERRPQKLLATLDSAGIDTVGEPFLLRYDDPGTPPFMRRNEVAVEVNTCA
jgi:hypothetical protein